MIRLTSREYPPPTHSCWRISAITGWTRALDLLEARRARLNSNSCRSWPWRYPPFPWKLPHLCSIPCCGRSPAFSISSDFPRADGPVWRWAAVFTSVVRHILVFLQRIEFHDLYKDRITLWTVGFLYLAAQTLPLNQIFIGDDNIVRSSLGHHTYLNL